MREVESS
jgi:hypothetical protein